MKYILVSMILVLTSMQIFASSPANQQKTFCEIFEDAYQGNCPNIAFFNAKLRKVDYKVSVTAKTDIQADIPSFLDRSVGWVVGGIPYKAMGSDSIVAFTIQEGDNLQNYCKVTLTGYNGDISLSNASVENHGLDCQAVRASNEEITYAWKISMCYSSTKCINR